MNIADKLTQIAENTPKVYEAGKEEGIEQGRKSVEESVGERLDDIIEVQNGLIGLESAPGIVTPDYVSEGLLIENGVLKGRGECGDSVIVVPEEVIEIGEGCFIDDELIETLILPESGGANISYNALDGSAIKHIKNSRSVTSFALGSAKNLELVTFVDIDMVGLTHEIALSADSPTVVYDFTKNTKVPRLWNSISSEGYGFNYDPKILVPLELYDEWIVATNWTEIAEYIVAVCVLSDDNEAKFDAVKNGVGEVYYKGYDKGYAEAEDITKGIIEQTLTEIVIPDGVKKIGRSAFFCYYDLKKVTIPEGVEIIQNGAFGWTSITELTLPLSCHTLEESALSSIYKAKKIKFGNVKNIGSRALAQQDSCVEYDFTACDSVPTLASADVFDYDKLNKNNPKILVPLELYAEWIAATNWAEYADYIVPYPFSFTIDGTSYQAEDGMTWEEWASSDYNTSDAFTPYQGYIVKSSSMSYHISLDGTNAVLGTDYVQASEYTTIYVSGAGGI